MKEAFEWQYNERQLRDEITQLLARCAHLEDQIDILKTSPYVLGEEAAPLYVPTEW